MQGRNPVFKQRLRAGYFGLHVPVYRRGEVLFELTPDLSADFADDCFPALGYLVGQTVGDRIPVIAGIREATCDQLKALGAAAAASGSVALYHLVGVTPEARTLEEALGGRTPMERIPVGRREIANVVAQMSTGQGGPVDV